MKNVKLLLMYAFGMFILLSGINHFVKPTMYFPFIPDFLPKGSVNILVGMAEIAVGVGVFIPMFRSWATVGILALMIIFLPLHVIDVFKDQPAIGNHNLALIRLPIQFILILWARFILIRP